MALLTHRFAAVATLCAAATVGAFTLPALAQQLAATPATTETSAASPSAALPPGAEKQRGMHQRHTRDPAKMQERRAKHLAEFRAKLHITASQESAWNTFTESMQPDQRRARLDYQDMAQLTTPERIDRMRALRAQRSAQADQRGDAVKALYAVLAPAQQKTFDEHTRRMQGQHGARGGYGEHGGHGKHHGHHSAHGGHYGWNTGDAQEQAQGHGKHRRTAP